VDEALPAPPMAQLRGFLASAGSSHLIVTDSELQWGRLLTSRSTDSSSRKISVHV